MSGFAVGTFVGPAGVRILSFEDGLAKLNGKPQKKLEHNTYLVKINDESLGVKLHDTIVVYIFKSGIYQLDTGGWRSATTKNRMNRYGPAMVYQKNGLWYVGNGIYEDGVRVNSKGKVLSPQRGIDVTEAKKRKLDRMVRKYIKGFGAHVLEHGLASHNNTEKQPWNVVDLTGKPQPLAPSPGDCWSCYFISTDPLDPLKEPLGCEHLLNHMTDEAGPYFIPSLLWKAIVLSGYQNPGFIWSHIADQAQRGETDFLKSLLTGYFRKRKSAMLELMD